MMILQYDHMIYYFDMYNVIWVFLFGWSLLLKPWCSQAHLIIT